MWYYSTDGKEKVGPISDPAISVLLKRGKITKTTKVWSPHQKEWLPLCESDIYKKIKSKKQSSHLVTLERLSRVFRAFLVSFFACMLFFILFYFESIHSYREFLQNGELLDNATKVIQSHETAQTKRLISIILILMFAVSLFFGYKWVKIVVTNAKILKRRITYSPTFSAWCFVLPFVNLIIPKQVISEVMVVSLMATNSERKIPYMVLVRTWYVFWCMSNIMFVVSAIITPKNCEPDQFIPIYTAKILFLSTYAITIFLSLMIVTVIFGLQYKSLSKR